MSGPGVYSTRLEIAADGSAVFEMPRATDAMAYIIPTAGHYVTVDCKISGDWIANSTGVLIDGVAQLEKFTSPTFVPIQPPVVSLRFNAIGGAAVVEIAL